MTIKIRIKYKSERQVIEIADDAIINDAVCQAAIQFNIKGSFQLSLNGNDDLQQDDKLSDLGIISGDLLYLLNNPSNTSPVAMEISTESSTKEIKQDSLTAVKDVLLLKDKKAEKTKEVDDRKNEKKVNAKVILQSLGKNPDVSNASDFIFIAIHSFMLEVGFRSQNEEENGLRSNTWKNDAMKLYKTTYVSFDCLHCVCDLTATLTGSTLFINGTLESDDDVSVQMKVKIDDVIEKDHLQSKNPFFIYKNLEKFKKSVNKSIITELISSVKKAHGEISKTLETIPYELQLRIAKCLQMKSICVLARVCKMFRIVCNDEELWKDILIREFGISYFSEHDNRGTFKQTVKRLYQARLEQARLEKERMRPRMPLRPEFEVPPGYINPPFAQQGIPGMIGGSYDLYPAGGFQPGGFPSHFGGRSPLFPNTGRHPPNSIRHPPGSRYDPIGPLGIPPDDDFQSTRHSHPDAMRRPRFNNFDRFGGGGFI